MKKQARINIIIISGIILFLYFIVISTKTSQVENKSSKGSFPDIVFDTLVWSDEFNGNGPNIFAIQLIYFKYLEFADMWVKFYDIHL